MIQNGLKFFTNEPEKDIHTRVANILKSNTHYETLTGLFAAFMFLQLTVLGLGNHAGEGFLSPERRELVYYALQAFVILGFLTYAATDRLICRAHVHKRITAAVLAVFAIGTAVMLFADKATRFYLIVTYTVVLCLGYLGGATYHRMSRETAAGGKTAQSMGLGCAIAIALQFVLQIQWGITPFLPVFMLAAFVLLAVHLLRTESESESEGESAEKTPSHHLLFACLIAVVFVLFTSFYNGYIHHLQIQTDYTDYNVYSWPRLMLIPCYLLFAAIGDKRQGKMVPVVALCIALVAMLNSVLNGSAGAYRLNMCLFYCAIAASVSYYNLTFWHLAKGTKHPALWASMGRILDSVMVLVAGAIHISALPTAVVLTINIAGLAAIIVMLTVSGGFNLSASATQGVAPSLLSEEATFDRIREKYALTPREADVLRELVLTEDKQTVISERLSIKVTVLQKHVTQLYRKTGAMTRSGLTDLYRNTMIGL